MQSTPHRLSQTIWAVFRAARPVRHSSYPDRICCSPRIQNYIHPQTTESTQQRIALRFYSNRNDSSQVERRVDDAKARIHDALDARADIAADAESPLRKRQDETIVHASPESSSIVYTKDDSTVAKSGQPNSAEKKTSPLPSEKADVRSQLTTRFSHFMDNFQSQIFVASQRLNDLTGYTGIERLKREIDQQESHVQNTRQAVKDSRTKYAEAIAMRSATQREVNDLLQRKHAWSPQDLERFTNLYRSDHANEQAEQEAHQRLSDAEVRYEEASTKLAKSILARYHEEQIWSDKIRQMSTWGTWGLMGLNVLLFVVLQLAIEPWRRRRLVRGFEEKVEVALASREKENQELRAQLMQRSGGDIVAQATTVKPEPVVATAGEKLAESIVDAITGSSESVSDNRHTGLPERGAIEAAAEKMTTKEIRNEDARAATVASITNTVAEGGSPDVPMAQDLSAPPTSSRSVWFRLPSSMYNVIRTSCVASYDAVLHRFDTAAYIVLSQRQITTNFVEGLVTGVALAGGIILALNRTR